MTYRNMLETELVLIECWDLLDTMKHDLGEDAVRACIDRQARREEILHLLGIPGVTLSRSRLPPRVP